ncbi:type II secretion system F family protein [Thiohalorhabdus sp. Cl-TMA]|uniref:Type II secretion system F family protein n=1 Tax=Thiohalorhabdus methylotrophus TaxID=3242694 RepID=A0ABV4TRX2_9GAMM
MAEKKSDEKPKQIEFQWKGRDRQGTAQKGEIEAVSAEAATAALRQRGIIPAKVKKKPQPLFQKKEKIKIHDIVVMTRQLSTMIDAGLPLVEAFKLIARGSENGAMRKVIEQVAADIESGQPLQDALAAHPDVFDELYVNMIRAGEKGGILDTVLDRMATYLEKTEALRAKVKSAMFYPIAVIVVAALVTAVLMVFVIPKFEEIFAGFGTSLPAPTQFVIDLSRSFRSNWYWIFGGIIAAFFAFREAYRRSPKFHYQVDKYILKLPVFGNIALKASVARMTRTFATLSAAGVPMLEILDTVSRTAGNKVIQEAVENTQEAVSQGQRLSDPLEESGVFPPMVTQMIAIGEESGSLETMLAKIADFYESEVDAAVDGLTDLLEPIIMVVLGVVLGGLVISMYLPIFKMGQAIGG